MALTPRLPLAIFLPLSLGTLWLGFGWLPVGRAFPTPFAFGVAGSLFQIALAGTALAMVRRRNDGRRWLFDAHSPRMPAFSWSRSLGFAAGVVVLGVPGFLLYLAYAGVTWVEETTQGFVAFDFSGVSLADRRYVRDDQEIRLVGMMHIGEENAYRAIVSSFSTESTVVLAEGLTDREGLLRDSLHYGGAAEALGLAPQQDLQAYLVDPGEPGGPPPRWPEIRHADLDASHFEPETIEWLRWASGIWGAERAELSRASSASTTCSRLVGRSPPCKDERAAASALSRGDATPWRSSTDSRAGLGEEESGAFRQLTTAGRGTPNAACPAVWPLRPRVPGAVSRPGRSRA
jgi:hypothetical protein